MNVYMLTCSEAVSQSCSHEQVGALKNARQTRRRTPMPKYDFDGAALHLH